MSVKDFPGHPGGSPFESDQIQRWLVSLSNRQNIDLQQELTSVADGDFFYVFDVSETGNVKTKKITRANLLAGQINALLDISGASGGQIKFPATQSASSDANTLDDYEEGTWTVGVSFGGGTTGITYTSQVGTYTKIGNRALASGRCSLSSKGSSTGNMLITGFPFTVENVTNLSLANTITGNGYAAGVASLGSNMVSGTTTANMFSFAAGTLALLTDASFTNTSNFNIGTQYSV